MKMRFNLFQIGAAGVALCSLTLSVQGATPRTAQSETNAVPRSEFVIPTHRSQGRDPFFPRSTRLNVVTNTAPVVVQQQVSPVRLTLQGISGTPDQRFAIVNGETVTNGESAEVNSNGTRIRFRCVEVRESSCVVEIGTERRELFLRSN